MKEQTDVVGYLTIVHFSSVYMGGYVQKPAATSSDMVYFNKGAVKRAPLKRARY